MAENQQSAKSSDVKSDVKELATEFASLIDSGKVLDEKSAKELLNEILSDSGQK